ncbi:putative FAD/NAD(P)-binding oxidoreductase family protein [Tanacetum coccineum]
MNPVATKVAVIGAGRAVCASNLAKNGISVTLFESARGPGGRMSRRRETTEDGKELYFDHGAPYFSTTNADVEDMIRGWEARGLVAEWKQNFGSFDYITKTFVNSEKDGLNKKYVGIPGMNSICRALCNETGIESKFGVMVGKLEWLENEDLWSLKDKDGHDLGQFNGVITSDKSTFSQRFTQVSGIPPPLDLNVTPVLADKVKDVPVRPCFALMLAFENPLSSIPLKGFSFENSEVLSWAICESSKPGRSASSERWVLRSTEQYAEKIIAQAGLQKPSNAALTEIAEELFKEFQRTGFDMSAPFFKKAHRWGSAFPATSIAKDAKCIWDGTKKLAICGDFCVLKPKCRSVWCYLHSEAGASTVSLESAADRISSGWRLPTDFPSNAFGSPNAFKAKWAAFCPEIIIAPKVGPYAMALCKYIGYPDLFITFTCNPKWPEIAREVDPECVRPEDRPDLISRVFMKSVRDTRLFGRIQALSVVYTVEFQKRGLPHAHICLFLHVDDKLPSPAMIDNFISAEIPDIDEDPELYVLTEVLLRSNNRSLSMFEGMPFPDDATILSSNNRLIHDELSYKDELKEEHVRLKASMTDEQKKVYETIMSSAYSGTGRTFFLYSYGGMGKTFIWMTLAAAIRCRGDIVLNVASSGIASLLMSGGRTAHSRFVILINCNEDFV